MNIMDRRAFLARGAAFAGGVAIAGPLQAFGARVASAQSIASPGYGPLIDMGDLWLPEGFEYRVISRRSDRMEDVDLMTDVDPVTGARLPMPSRFDGMATFDDSVTGDTILIRNHENQSRRGDFAGAETPVEVPNPYDPITRLDGRRICKGGVVKLVVRNREVVTSTALLGGTIWNCAGGQTPWNTWITCEEETRPPASPIRHGYIFEVDAFAAGPVDPVPIKPAGRFDHEAVVWHDESLYLTEDKHTDAGGACFYRYTPSPRPTAAGDLAASSGPLDALVVDGHPRLLTSTQWPLAIGEPLSVSWVTVPDPDPAFPDDPSAGVRFQAQTLGAAIFQRTEGCWLGDDKIYFDCTTGGPSEFGQIWELDPRAMELRLIFQSDDASILFHPDNLAVAPTDDLFICEDTGGGPVPHLRALTPDGLIYDFARASRGGRLEGTNLTEFCGTCFSSVPRPKPGEGLDLSNLTLYVNQQGTASSSGSPGITYAIWGPWKRD